MGSPPRPENWGDPPAVDLPAVEPLRWTRLDTLLDARNEKYKRPVLLRFERDLREAWLADLEYSSDPDARVKELTLEPDEAQPVTRFAILGDPGEGDLSQLAVVRPLLARHRHLPPFGFAVVLSDVIYPSGASAEYPRKFYGPYHGFRRPIYAIPGNHDWDDGSLTGFMTHFTRSKTLRRVDEAGAEVKRAIAALGWRRHIWHGARPPGPDEVRHALGARKARDERLKRRGASRYPVGQPNSYFRLRVGRLWLVCIDTGMKGTVDQPQAEWLIRVSEQPGPKILLTGKPLVVNARRRPCEIVWDGGAEGRPANVAEIVETDEYGYIASIGGDVHNYQRYEGTTDAGRPLPHLVAGGSGAFLSSTELIGIEGKTDVLPKALYPTRGLSRVHFEWGVANRLLGSRLLPGTAAATAFVLSALFALLRGATFDDGWRIAGSVGLGLFAGLLVVGALLTIARPATAREAGIGTAAVGVIQLIFFGGRDPRWVVASMVALLAVVGLWRVHRLTRNWRLTAWTALIATSPLFLGVVIPFDERIRPERPAFFAGYGLASAVFALLAITLGRKLAAGQGMTARERRPYSTLGLAAAVWLLLMVVLAAYGTLSVLWSFSFRQLAFVVVTGLAVLVAAVLTHLEWGRHLAYSVLLWLGLVGGGLLLLYGWGWHDDALERQALRYGFFEATIALLVGMGLVIAALTVYARKLRPATDPQKLKDRVREAEELYARGQVQPRDELIAAILRAVGASSFLGPIFEASDPPMLKSFLDVEVRPDAVTITAYRASGFETEADDPPPVDRVRIPLPPD